MKIQVSISTEAGKDIIEGVLHLASENYDSIDGQRIITVNNIDEIEDGYSYIESIDDSGVAIIKKMATPSSYHQKQQEEEKKKHEKEDEIFTLERYLNNTDYVITKLNELKLEDDDEYNAAKEKYSNILLKRKQARSRINELENEE